ncbi:Putative negative regulator of RcsB-dependent stress response [Fontimonas thermophila]|uniref:Ancillary SecYEG translocon subunit n=1 Tax=Fontimonas thermophila TaxID=1076937 RepID=A0A1I2JK83_9GAMM|nr:tetratricopeptide repeat protein [Fontimonas thermophila]SFF54649.1 Putative negative regulator of RcsB-dependent stress response [Fontimonas thermophila]
MTTHFEDEDQAERLKQWWKENWLALAGGLVIGLAAIFGWEAWQSHQDRRAQQASRMYEDLKKAIADARAQEAVRIGDALVAEYAGTPYAAGAALFLAAEAFKNGKPDEALVRLRWVREKASDPGLRQVARLREARVLWQQNQLDAALRLLDGDMGEFTALAEELRGDIHLAQGDRAAARAAYEKALTATAEDPAARAGLQRKIDDLADVVQS